MSFGGRSLVTTKIFQQEVQNRARQMPYLQQCQVDQKVVQEEKKRSAKYVGELASTDQGVFKNHAARDGTSYMQTFIDHASKYVTAYGRRKKLKAIENLKKYIARVDQPLSR